MTVSPTATAAAGGLQVQGGAVEAGAHHRRRIRRLRADIGLFSPPWTRTHALTVVHNVDGKDTAGSAAGRRLK